MVVGTTSISLFLLRQVSIVWHVLPQLVNVYVHEFGITTCTIGLTTILAFGVVNKTL